MRQDLKDLWDKAKQNGVTLRTCPRHEFTVDLTPDKALLKRWQCARCGGVVDSTAKHWYELGLNHAQQG